jgi:hypothetical protein
MGHIRSQGVTRQLVYCANAVWCHHQAELDGDFLAGETQLTPLCRRMVCTRCGFIGAETCGHKPGKPGLGSAAMIGTGGLLEWSTRALASAAKM